MTAAPYPTITLRMRSLDQKPKLSRMTFYEEPGAGVGWAEFERAAREVPERDRSDMESSPHQPPAPAKEIKYSAP